MVKKPTTDKGFDCARLREAANHLTNGLIEQLHDILKHSAQENLKGARRCGQTAINLMQAAAVLRTIHDYADMTSRRLRQIASLMQLEEVTDNKSEYLELCDREGPACDCEMVCKHKPKNFHTEAKKALADAERRSRQFFQNEPPNG